MNNTLAIMLSYLLTQDYSKQRLSNTSDHHSRLARTGGDIKTTSLVNGKQCGHLTGQISIICYSLHLTLLVWLTGCYGSHSEHNKPPPCPHTLIPPITCGLAQTPQKPPALRWSGATGLQDWQQAAVQHRNSPPVLFVFLSMFRLGAPGLHLNIRLSK